ncbi:MAG: hypothetical protein QNJ92_00025 [Alphaproteobacteria bacterium]|nr:hypothetical protein [Alphaproteobacteria bacterium]
MTGHWCISASEVARQAGRPVFEFRKGDKSDVGLISAAPDLYQALCGILEQRSWYEETGPEDWRCIYCGGFEQAGDARNGKVVHTSECAVHRAEQILPSFKGLSETGANKLLMTTARKLQWMLNRLSSHPTMYELTSIDRWQCTLCGAIGLDDFRDGDNVVHNQDCPLLRAQAALAKAESLR